MEEKKGQVTLFIILAIVIMGGVGAFYLFKPADVSNDEISPAVAPVNVFVNSCVDAAITKSILVVGEGGGYYFTPKDASDNGGLVYYYYKGKNFFPSKSEVEEKLSRAVETNILLCVKDFEKFKPMNISRGEINVEVEISDNEVLFNVKYPLKINLGEQFFTLEDFGIHEIPVRLGLIHSVVKELIDSGYYNENEVCIDCFLDILYKYNLEFDLLDGGDQGSVIIIYDRDEKTIQALGKEFKYVFALE